MKPQLALFDCDETLWHSAGRDYISSLPSILKRADGPAVERSADGQIFSLRSGVVETFRELHDSGVGIGIVSDNLVAPVIKALELFGLYRYVKSQAFNVRLWDGYCNKPQMVEEIIARTRVEPSSVYVFDDKNYRHGMDQIGVHFVQVPEKEDMNQIVSASFTY